MIFQHTEALERWIEKSYDGDVATFEAETKSGRRLFWDFDRSCFPAGRTLYDSLKLHIEMSSHLDSDTVKFIKFKHAAI